MLCKGITKKGTACRFKAKSNGYCLKHRPTESLRWASGPPEWSDRRSGGEDRSTECNPKEKCCICTEETTNQISLKCSHSYCMKCIGEWYAEKDECPLCKEKIVFGGTTPPQNIITTLSQTILKQRKNKVDEQLSLRAEIEDLKGQVEALRLTNMELNTFVNMIALGFPMPPAQE